MSFLEVVYTIIGACYIGKLFEFPVIHTLDLCAGGEEFDRAFRVRLVIKENFFLVREQELSNAQFLQYIDKKGVALSMYLSQVDMNKIAFLHVVSTKYR